MLRLLLLLQALTLLFTACAPAPLTPPALQDCPVPMTVNTLARVSMGLLYPSETDAPFSPVQFPGQCLPIAATVAQFVRLEAAAVEMRDFDAFFARLTTPADPQDPASVQIAQRFRLLHDTLRRSYDVVQVYRVQERANPAVWRIFMLGEDRCGVSGLATWAVET